MHTKHPVLTALLPAALLAAGSLAAASGSAARGQAAPAAIAGTPIPVGTSSIRISYEHASLINTLANTGVTGVGVAAVPLNPNEPPSGAAPAHVEFRFSAFYPSLFKPGMVLNPLISVVPTAHFADYRWTGAMRSLQALLKAHSSLRQIKTLPYLPTPSGNQVLHIQEAYLRFAGGEGIRYLALFAQDPAYVTANRMFYTFQGITADGKYYVYATFPVHIAGLPGTMPANLDYNTYVRTYTAYLHALAKKLDGILAPGALTPAPAQLDTVLSSVATNG